MFDLKNLTDDELKQLEDEIDDEQALRFSDKARIAFNAAQDSTTIVEMFKTWRKRLW